MKKCLILDAINLIILYLSIVIIFRSDIISLLLYLVIITYLAIMNWNRYKKDKLLSKESVQEYKLWLAVKIIILYINVVSLYFKNIINIISLVVLLILLTVDAFIILKNYGYEQRRNAE